VKVMDLLGQHDRIVPAAIGQELHHFAAELYPICRSITGDGMRRTLASIQQKIPLEISEVATGTTVLDWTVPKEWNIRDAYIKSPDGERVVDFQQCNLHVMSYSAPVRATLPLAELRPRLFTLPQHPEWIPYRTCYYNNSWGFCLPHNRALALKDGDYEVVIDSVLEDGHLTYGECYLPGRSKDEILISCHACHPSLANDNLSGLAIATFLARMLTGQEHAYSYRFLFIPGTIGAITWLARNREAVARIRHGLVLACLGDQGGFHYKKSRQGETEIDRAVAHVLRHHAEGSRVVDFSPLGYDERQYCSPGFNLAVGCLMRSMGGSFPEYHTSADNLDFIRPLQLAGSLRMCAAILDVLENNRRFLNRNPYGEPQLGRRNLYPPAGGGPLAAELPARLWVLNLSDARHSLLDIAERSGIPFPEIRNAAEILCQCGMLVEVADGGKEDA
jgi:aminopeptidase-like protein